MRTHRLLFGSVLAALAGATGAVGSAAGGAPAARNVIKNGNFSRGLTDWPQTTVSSGSFSGYPKFSATPNAKCQPKQAGNPNLEMDVPGGADGYVQQRITVPKSPQSLRFRTWGNLDPVTASVSVVTSSGAIRRLLTYTPPPLESSETTCSKLKPAIKTISLKAFAGQTIELRFEATAQGVDGTFANLDDITLTGATAHHRKPHHHHKKHHHGRKHHHRKHHHRAQHHPRRHKNAIRNGDFTAGLRGWSRKKLAGGTYASYGYPKMGVATSSGSGWSWMQQCARFQGSRPFLYLDVPGGAAGYVQQRLTVPKHPGQLKFRSWGNLDPVQVTISIVTANHAVHTVLSYSPPTLQSSSGTGCSGAGPVRKSISMTAFAGQKVSLRVQATSSQIDGTIADFDNFAL